MAFLVFPTVHHLLFVLLPAALAARAFIQPKLDVLDVAQGVMRFCLGFAKWVLLVSPLWSLSSMVLRGGVESLSAGVAWMGFLALMTGLHFLFTGTGDVIAGLGGLFGFKVADAAQEILTLRRFTQGRLPHLLAGLIVLTISVTLAQGTWQPLKALFAPAPRSIATVFQEARVLTDFHVVTLLAALASFIALPHSRDFLRTPLPWKAALCLPAFFLAMVMLWTRVAPIS